MRVKSSTVDEHAFRRVRRKGYDPSEVDSVMARVAETLREYETLTGHLETSLREAEESYEATRRTFLAAQRTRDEMIAEATDEADRLRREARDTSETLLADGRAEADRTVIAARHEAGQMLADARREADHLLESARAEAEWVLGDALAEATKLQDHVTASTDALLAARHAEAEAVAAAALAEAETLLTAAQSESDRTEGESHRKADALLAAAEAQRTELLAEAANEKERLERRVTRLRAAVAGIERELHELAETALGHVGAANTLIDLTVTDGPEGVRDGNSDRGGTVMAFEESAFADLALHRAAPDGSGRLPADRPDSNGKVVALPVRDPGDVEVGDTIYQRRGGGLRSRIAEGARRADAEQEAGPE